MVPLVPGLVDDAAPGEVMAPDGPMPVAGLVLLALGERGMDGMFCMPVPLLVPSDEPLPVVLDWVGLALIALDPDEVVAGAGGALLAAPAPMV